MTQTRLKKFAINGSILLLFILLSAFFVLPFMQRQQIFSSDDVSYHIARMNQLFWDFKNGNYFPAIANETFGKTNFAINLFYPWQTLVPFILIRFLIKNSIESIYIGIAFYTWLTFCLTYFVGKRMNMKRPESVIFSIFYVFSSYRTIDAFTRFDIGEFIALTFLPLCLYGFYSCIFGKNEDWPLLSIGALGIAYSHILSTVIVAFFLLCVFIVSYRKIQNRISRLISLLKAIVITIAGYTAYLLPFIEQITYQKYKQPSKIALIDADLSGLIINSLNNNLARSVYGMNAYNIGFIGISVCIVAAIGYRRLEPEDKKIFLLGVGIFIGVSSVFPWGIFTNTPLDIIQFTFRILMLATVLLSFVGAKIMYNWFDFNTPVKLMLVVLIATIPWYSGCYRFINSYHANMPSLTFTNHSIYHETDIKNYFLNQYVSADTEKHISSVVNHESIIDGKNTVRTFPKVKNNELIFSVNSLKGETIDLPVFLYKNVTVKSVNKQLTIKKSKRATIQIVSLKNGLNKYEVYYKVSVIDIVGVALACFTLLTLIFILMKKMLL